jgi:hypothetical protein
MSRAFRRSSRRSKKRRRRIAWVILEKLKTCYMGSLGLRILQSLKIWSKLGWRRRQGNPYRLFQPQQPLCYWIQEGLSQRQIIRRSWRTIISFRLWLLKISALSLEGLWFHLSLEQLLRTLSNLIHLSWLCHHCPPVVRESLHSRISRVSILLWAMIPLLSAMQEAMERPVSLSLNPIILSLHSRIESYPSRAQFS